MATSPQLGVWPHSFQWSYGRLTPAQGSSTHRQPPISASPSLPAPPAHRGTGERREDAAHSGVGRGGVGAGQGCGLEGRGGVGMGPGAEPGLEHPPAQWKAGACGPRWDLPPLSDGFSLCLRSRPCRGVPGLVRISAELSGNQLGESSTRCKYPGSVLGVPVGPNREPVRSLLNGPQGQRGGCCQDRTLCGWGNLP